MNLVPGSDEDDDIESLRIAALQSLKRSHPFQNGSPPQFHSQFRMGRGKWGRFGHRGRAVKGVHFTNRIRSTNLISLTPASDEPDNTTSEENNSQPNNIVLKNNEEDNSSKFNRYNKSDKSESESEETELEADESGKLKKSDSLEAIMQELDDEIQGKSIIAAGGTSLSIEKPKVKKKKKKNTENTDTKLVIDNTDQPVLYVADTIDNSCVDKSQIILTNSAIQSTVGTTFRKRLRTRSPFNRIPYKRHGQRHYMETPPLQYFPFNPPPQFHPPEMFFVNPPVEPMFIPPEFNMPPMAQPYFERPLSPLAINTESLTTATLAPLSPRSAAFVMQNKAIIEKRKRSPRRSYSRSPSRSLSRSPRRSLSPPRRSLSPLVRRFRRSVSPRRSISPRRILSPRRSVSPGKSLSPRSPRRFSPRKRSLSPRRRSVSPNRKPSTSSIRNKPAIYNRLGLKSDNPEENKDKPKENVDKENKDKPKEKEIKQILEEELVDPVLAARKKKFETNELNKRQGIIRLKPKEEKAENLDTIVVISKPAKNESASTVTSKNEEKPNVPANPIIISKPISVSKPTENPKIPILASKPIVSSKPIEVEKIAGSSNPVTTSISTENEKKNTPPASISKPTASEKASKVVTSEKNVKETSSALHKSIDFDDDDEFKELERLLNDDSAIDEFLLDHKVGDIFSDEESASDNEGRFKAKEKQGEKVPVLPFTKLVNGTKQDIKTEPLQPYGRTGKNRNNNTSTERNTRDQLPSYSKEREREEKKERSIKSPKRTPPVREKITLHSEQTTARPLERKERKIGIRIKNPSKYEKNKMKLTKPEIEETRQYIVPLQDDISDDSDNDDIIFESGDESDDDDNALTQGDLRTQLSRKRAEKLRMPVEHVSSRLLQYALQGALLKKSKKKSKRKSLLSSDQTDWKSVKQLLADVSEGKLPIHFRLGITGPHDIEELKVKKKKKRKNRDLLEQQSL